MKWNYRVVKNGEDVEIHEAYYDDQMNLLGLAEEAICMVAATPDDLMNKLNLMLEGFNNPILDYQVICSADSEGEWILEA